MRDYCIAAKTNPRLGCALWPVNYLIVCENSVTFFFFLRQFVSVVALALAAQLPGSITIDPFYITADERKAPFVMQSSACNTFYITGISVCNLWMKFANLYAYIRY